MLHIGAHRTGSTMVAQSLAATIEAHPDCGVALWGPRHLRAIGGFQATASMLDRHVEPINRSAAAALEMVASKLARDAKSLREQGIRRLIISEENFVGSMRQNFMNGTFYGDVSRKLAAYDSLLPISPMWIALGVRDYGTVWTSAFHYMPQMGRKQPDPDVARDTLMSNKRGWPEVAAAARAVWPQSEIMMWRQEQLASQAAEICAQLTGLDAGQIVMPDGKINARSNQIPKPAIFSDDDAKRLSQRYDRHILRLKSADNIRWIGEDAP